MILMRFDSADFSQYEKGKPVELNDKPVKLNDKPVKLSDKPVRIEPVEMPGESIEYATAFPRGTWPLSFSPLQGTPLCQGSCRPEFSGCPNKQG